MSYIPRLGSAAQRAISYLGRVKGEVSTADLADAIACTPYGLGRTLGRAVDAGLLIKRQHKAGTSAPLFWSLPAESVAEAVAPKPEPATDIPVVQRTVPAAEAGPSGWTPHPLDAAWHPRAANGKDSSALDAGQHAGGEAAQAPHPESTGPVATSTPTNGRPPARDDEITPASPRVGAMGAGQPTDVGPVEERVTLSGLRGIARGALDDETAEQYAERQRSGWGPVDTLIVEERAALVGKTATISMTGEIAVVAECGAVVLFDAQRAQQLLAFFAGRVG